MKSAMRFPLGKRGIFPCNSPLRFISCTGPRLSELMELFSSARIFMAGIGGLLRHLAVTIPCGSAPTCQIAAKPEHPDNLRIAAGPARKNLINSGTWNDSHEATHLLGRRGGARGIGGAGIREHDVRPDPGLQQYPYRRAPDGRLLGGGPLSAGRPAVHQLSSQGFSDRRCSCDGTPADGPAGGTALASGYRTTLRGGFRLSLAS